MPRVGTEITEHDQLVLMMVRHFQQLGYSNVKADVPGWPRPDYIYWTNNPNDKYYPDLTCVDTNGVFVLLEAETCGTFNDRHTQNQFKIFSAHASNVNGRFEVVVPRSCSGLDARELIRRNVSSWGVSVANIWTPGS
jgi:hypothetical protein